MSESFSAEMSCLMPEVPSHGSARARSDLHSTVRGDAPSDGSTSLASERRPLGGALKRAADLVIAAVSLMAFLPLVTITALLVLLTMGRPVFYAHSRVGFERRPFNCLKFRSMVRDPDQVLERHLAENPEAAREWNDTQKLRNDPRVTFVGRMLRKSSLDELPQLINVLRGEMSCVGPRPVVADELARYGAKAPLYLSTRPGMTGLWQVSGRSSVDYPTRVALDETYVRSWSVLLDLKILFSTVFILLNAGDAA
jgi:exopolysaccharide production protein ExoY